MKQQKLLSGYITIDNNKYVFTLDNYRGKIFNNAPNVFFARKVELPKIVYGVTDTNYNIALCISNPHESGNCIVFSCPYYIIDNANCFNYNICEFNEIEFIGESLNLIIDPEDIYDDKFKFEDNIYEKGCSIKFKPLKDVSKKFNFNLLNKDVEFEYSIIPYQKRKQNKLGETNSKIKIKFQSIQKIEELEKWYLFITKLTSLLVLQHNVDFDSIRLFYEVALENGKKMNHYANLFVNQNHINLVSNNPIRCLELKLFNDHMQNLINILENDKFSIMFLPDSNNEKYTIDFENVKNICTALEFEFKENEMKLEKNQLITQLQKLVKLEVKKFKDLNPSLNDDDFANIKRSIDTWTLPAKKQIWALYETNIDIMEYICDKKAIGLSYQNIKNFVQFRNNITHGEFPQFNEEIVNTAYALKILIYVSLLKRIGLEDDIIKDRLCFVF